MEESVLSRGYDQASVEDEAGLREEGTMLASTKFRTTNKFTVSATALK